MWLTASLSVSISIVLMQLTKNTTSPGGATALIAVTGSEEKKHGILVCNYACTVVY
jgi:CBS-domain-containing membrane protein